METQQLVLSALIPSYKMFPPAVNNRDTLRSFHVKCPTVLSDFNQTWSFSADFRKIHQYKMLRKSAS